jgi:hypothetical protein
MGARKHPEGPFLSGPFRGARVTKRVTIDAERE